MRNNQKFRDLIADLILKDDNNQDLVVVSNLDKNEDGSMQFVVGEDNPGGARYKIRVSIEEI